MDKDEMPVSILDIPGLTLDSDAEDVEEDATLKMITSQLDSLKKQGGSKDISAIPSGSGMTFIMASSDEEELAIDAQKAKESQKKRAKKGGRMSKQSGEEEGSSASDNNESKRAKTDQRSQMSFEDFFGGVSNDEDDDFDEDEESLDPDAAEEEAGASNKKAINKRKIVQGGKTNEGDAKASGIEQKRERAKLYLDGQVSFKDFIRELSNDEAEEDDNDESDGGEDHGRKEPKASDQDDDDDEDWMPRTGRRKRRKSREGTGKRGRPKAKKGEGRRKRRGKKLDPTLQGLMGEANLRYVRGDKETAIRMCMEVIRQNPTAPEPFQTLATLYEEAEDNEKALQFSLIAAHLAPQDAHEWQRLAEMALEMGDKEQACLCYRKAINADVQEAKYHFARAQLLEEMGEIKAAIRGYKRLLGVLKNEDGENYLSACKDLSRLLHHNQDLEAAKGVMSEGIRLHSKLVTLEHVNLTLELQIALKCFDEALEVLCEHCSVKFKAGKELDQGNIEELDPQAQLEAFQEVVIQKEIPEDILAKLVVVLVQLDATHLVKTWLNHLLSWDAEALGDLLLDVAEALMEKGYHTKALPLLGKLTQSETYSQAAVWLKHGECLIAADDLKSAEDSYRRVIEMAPQHHEAKRTLANVLNALDRPEEALQVLDQDEAELLNPMLLFERCQLLLKEDCLDDFVTKAELFFTRHFTSIWTRDEMEAVVSSKKIQAFTKKSSQTQNRKKSAPVQPVFEKELIALDREFELYLSLCSVLINQGRFGRLQRVTFSALGSAFFGKNAQIVKECEFLCLMSSYFNNDSFHAFNFARALCTRDTSNSRLWNILNLVVMKADDVRHNRFLLRLVTTNANHRALSVLNANNALIAGTYKYALGEYMAAFRANKNDPLPPLMIGLTFVHMACQKFSARKHALVTQACAFLQYYVKLRGRSQESCYNMGRAMHQLGLLPAALHFYKQALDLDPVIKDDECFDLSREIAFNIVVIYKASESFQLARFYLQKYLVI